MQKVPSTVSAVIAGRAFEFTAADVSNRAGELEPEAIRDHFVVIDGKRFPPKQVMAALTGLDRADFTTHQARSLLRRIGFVVSRASTLRTTTSVTVGEQAPAYGADAQGTAEAEELRPHKGRWVALKDGTVLFAAADPEEVLRWLERNARKADSLFAVPMDPTIDIGGFAL